jgi:hypothetical protein
VVPYIESTIEHKDIALGAFLAIEGAFDRTSFDIIKQAAEEHGIEPAICRYINAMLESKVITPTLSGETLGASASRVVRRRVCSHTCCEAWLRTISCGDSMMMDVIQ